MGVYDTFRKILGFPSGYDAAKQQRVQQEINKQYSTPAPSYTSPLSYPTASTKVKPGDVLYKTKEDWQRAHPARDINKVYDVHQLARSPIIMQMYPQEPGEFESQYIKRLERIVEKTHQPKNLNTPLVHYNPNPTQDFFGSRKLNPKQRSFVSLDIETDDYGHPISISALKFQYDKKAQKFVNVDNYQRFYQAHNWNLRTTEAVHGFTASALKALRKQQGATYGKTYKGQEVEDLADFLGSSIIVGHNIQNFDLDKLFSDRIIKNSTIDTLAAARNAWKGSRNDLDSVFKRIFGKTMEQSGLSHHDANADTIASMMILEAMHKDPGRVGEAIRYVMGSRGQRQLVEYDEYLKSMIVKGTYKSTYVGKGGSRKLGEVYMTAEEAGLKKNGKMIEGFSEMDVSKMDPDRMSDDELLRSAGVDLVNYYKERAAQSDVGAEAIQAMNTYTRYQQMNLISRVAAAKSQATADAILESAGYGAKAIGSQSIIAIANKLKSAREKDELQKMIEDAELGNWRSEVRDLNLRDEYSFDRNEALRKMRYLDKAERSGMLWGKDRQNLDNLVGSYDDLVDATEDVIDANKRLLTVYEAIGKIKPYDINQYIASAKGQWGGVMGASKGVVPNFLRNPISRLGDAAFNAVDRSVAPWNAVQRTWNSGIGQAVTAAGGVIGGIPGMMIGGAISGLVSAGTQVYGNYKQAKMEMLGLSIQNNLNTLGAMVSWIATPFQLLHKAAKLLIGSFSGLSLKLNNIMGSGISDMSQLGNPLEQLTGVDYLKYQGTTLMDLASLTSKGSTNKAIESMAVMQRDLYRFGKVDTTKLLAANMLGVFNEAFTPTNDAVGSYYSMGNKILNNLYSQTDSQRADTLYYVTQLNETLAQTLRSALMMGVTDLNQLTNPSAFHTMYWRPISDSEEGSFRKTQYEYGVATQQFGYSKMRFADRLWNFIGRDLYNGLNELVDKAAGGNWKGVLDSASNMWANLKEKFSEIWNGKEGEGGIGESVLDGLNKGWAKIKEWGLNVAVGILDIWNQLVRKMLEKSQDLISYLSTIKVDLVRREGGGWGIDISTIKDVTAPEGNKHIYERTGSMNYGLGQQSVKKGYEGYALLADLLYPNATQWEKDALTIDQLKEKFLETSLDPNRRYPLEMAKYQLFNLNPQTMEEVDDIFDTVARIDSGRGVNSAAAARLISGIDKSKWRIQEEDSPILNAYDDLVADMMDIVTTTKNYVASGGGEAKEHKVVFDFKLGDKKATVTYQQGKGLTVTGMPLLQQVGLGNGMSVAISKSD